MTDPQSMTSPGAELRRVRSLIADLDAIVWEADAPTMTHRFVSEGAADILGHSPRDWVDDPSFWADHLHPEDRSRAVGEFVRAATEGGHFDMEYRFIAADDSVVWLRDLGHVAKDVDGNPSLMRGLMVDISTRKLGDAERAEVETRYRTLVEQLPAIVYSEPYGSAALDLLYISPRVREILGIPPERWMGDPSIWLASMHEDDRARVEAANRDADETGEPFEAEYRMVAADGRVVWFHDQAILVRDADGTPLFWQGVMLDITVRKDAERLVGALEAERETARHLRDVDEMKNTFLQAVSHDLRTPLAAILGLAITLSREDITMDADEARDLAGRIAQNARKLDRIVNDLLDIDRLSRGIVEPTLRMADVGELIRALVEESDLTIERRIEVDVEPVTIPVDASKVERIMENLLANTARHTSHDARVWVRVRGHEDGALLVVEDDGPGVPDELRETIFEPFTQGDPSSPSPGVGVGLTLVARFAELHGGRAWVQPREGGGASFRVFLPSTPAGPIVEDDAQPTETGSSGPDASQA